MKRYEIAKDQKTELEAARKANKDKRRKKRLHVLIMRKEKRTQKSQKKMGYSFSRVGE